MGVFSVLCSDTVFFLATLLVCSIFSFLETSISSVRLFKLKQLSKKTVRYKKLLEIMERNPDKILSTILIAKNIADVSTAMLSGHIIDMLSAQWHLSDNVTLILSIGLATVAIIVFGEIIPKSIAKLQGERLLGSSLWLINLLYYVLYPLSFLTKFARFLALKINRFNAKDEDSDASEEEIQFLIEQVNEEGLIEPEKVNMLMSVFRLSQKSVREIMVPKSDIVAVSSDLRLKDAITTFSKYQLSRMPCYQKSFDNMVGMVYQKDLFTLLHKNEDCKLSELVRPLIFVPEYMKLNQLLNEFRNQHMHLAIVINEFGNIDGLVTLEDVLEQIVGEIREENEGKSPKILQVKPGGWLVDASVNLTKVASLLQISFEKTQASTLGGFLTEQFQRLPKKGEQINYKDFQFQIRKVSPKQVFQVLIIAGDAKIKMNDLLQKGEVNSRQDVV